VFELLDRDGFARRGRLATPHGTVETPALLPVVHPDPARQPVSPKELHETFGFRAVITSSYLLRRQSALRERAVHEGLHKLLGFPGTIMTDSGAFQQHSRGEVDATPSQMLEFQNAIGSDIATVLDEFVEPEATYEEAAKGVATTIERARAARSVRGERLLAVPVQGGLHAELRARSAAGASEMGDVLAVGGIVPLMEHYRLGDLSRVLAAVRPQLAPERPVHLFGLGHPMLFAFGALFGGDLFDSSSYHKFAERSTLLFPEGSLPLDAIEEEVCACARCERVPLLQVKDLPEPERREHLARHNLDQCVLELARVRQAIRDGELWELAETRSAVHPAMAAALDEARAHPEVFLPVEPASRRSFRIVVPGSRQRPAVVRFRRAREAWVAGKAIAGSTPRRPLSPSSLRNAPDPGAGVWEVESPLGPVPLELSETYPTGPLVAPEDYAPRRVGPSPREPLPRSEAPAAVSLSPEDRSAAWVHRHLEGILAWSFGTTAARALAPERWRGIHSRSTGRLRQLYDGTELLFVVGNDGLPRPTFVGGERLRRALPPPRRRVVAHADAVPFVSEGRSLFSRHVVSADPELHPDDVVLVVDADDRLLAVGRTLLAAHELGKFRRGVAVRVVSHARGSKEEGIEENEGAGREASE
jgi:7-cyano-7-deazaguanine tRNA-ribosyltransferase